MSLHTVAAPALPDLTRRASFSFFTEESLRFADLDKHAHVNNVAMLTLFENVRVRFMEEATKPGGTGFVLGRIECDYRRQVYYPGQLSAACRVLSVGRASVRLGQAVFRGDEAVATGVAVIVTIDRQTGNALPLPPHLRTVFDALAAQ